MSYSNPNRLLIPFLHANWAGGETFSWIGPKGKACRLWDYGVYGVTTGITTTATIAIGDGSDADAYGEEFATVVADNHAKSVRQTYRLESEIDDYILNGGLIPADQEVVLTITAGGAGAGTAFMILDYDW